MKNVKKKLLLSVGCNANLAGLKNIIVKSHTHTLFSFLFLGNNEDISFSRPADLDLIQSTPFKPLALKTPPRVLTLSERPLDFLDLERPLPTPQSEEVNRITTACIRKLKNSVIKHTLT
jgi:hypothetical protein